MTTLETVGSQTEVCILPEVHDTDFLGKQNASEHLFHAFFSFALNLPPLQ